MLEKKKVFLFDMDGLLIDSENMHLQQWKVIFERHEINNGIEVLYKVIGVTGAMSREILKRETGNENFFMEYRKEKETMMNEFLEANGMPVKEGAKELLSYLKARQYPMVLVSSTPRERLLRFLKLAHLDGYFTSMVCGDEVTKSKPDPEGYLKAVSDHGFNIEECVVLEDSKNGIKAANLAGIDVIGIPDLIDISECNCVLYTSLLEVLNDLKKKEKQVLVTGFEPFGNDPINPTKEALPLLPDCYLNFNITKQVLPVDCTCFDSIHGEYDIYLSMGLAASRAQFTIEQIGINIDDFRIPTNASEIKNHEIIHQDGADGYFTTLPIDPIIEHLKNQNIEMKISYSAGTYICNHLLYEYGYHYHDTSKQYGFIHVPKTDDYESIKEMVLGVMDVL